MAPGAKTSLAPPWWNLSSFESKFAVLRKVLLVLLGLFGGSRSDLAPPAVIQRPHSELVPGELRPPFPPRYAPECSS